MLLWCYFQCVLFSDCLLSAVYQYEACVNMYSDRKKSLTVYMCIEREREREGTVDRTKKKSRDIFMQATALNESWYHMLSLRLLQSVVLVCIRTFCWCSFLFFTWSLWEQISKQPLPMTYFLTFLMHQPVGSSSHTFRDLKPPFLFPYYFFFLIIIIYTFFVLM